MRAISKFVSHAVLHTTIIFSFFLVYLSRELITSMLPFYHSCTCSCLNLLSQCKLLLLLFHLFFLRFLLNLPFVHMRQMLIYLTHAHTQIHICAIFKLFVEINILCDKISHLSSLAKYRKKEKQK